MLGTVKDRAKSRREGCFLVHTDLGHREKSEKSWNDSDCRKAASCIGTACVGSVERKREREREIECICEEVSESQSVIIPLKPKRPSTSLFMRVLFPSFTTSSSVAVTVAVSLA
ncbi:hypothetical protein VNO77_05473 [Canavalia gladiata]|uniref:Uncharacterized protein n=1 Tax=Canavalia gladiata TaxID=3824 RepID=A0AAN9RA16_CANGL